MCWCDRASGNVCDVTELLETFCGVTEISVTFHCKQKLQQIHLTFMPAFTVVWFTGFTVLHDKIRRTFTDKVQRLPYSVSRSTLEKLMWHVSRFLMHSLQKTFHNALSGQKTFVMRHALWCPYLFTWSRVHHQTFSGQRVRFKTFSSESASHNVTHVTLVFPVSSHFQSSPITPVILTITSVFTVPYSPTSLLQSLTIVSNCSLCTPFLR